MNARGLGTGVVIFLLASALSGCVRRDEPPAAPSRPEFVPAPTRERPIAIWRETEEPLVNGKGDTRIAYRKLAGWRRDRATLALSIESRPNRRGGTQTWEVELPGAAGVIDGALHFEVLQGVLADPGLTVRREPRSREDVVVVTLGEGEGDRYRPLSGDLRVRCETRPAGQVSGATR